MSPEFFAIIGVGVALAGLIINGQHVIGNRIGRLEDRIAKLEERMNALEQRIARLEGLVRGFYWTQRLRRDRRLDERSVSRAEGLNNPKPTYSAAPLLVASL